MPMSNDFNTLRERVEKQYEDDEGCSPYEHFFVSLP